MLSEEVNYDNLKFNCNNDYNNYKQNKLLKMYITI